MMYSQLAYAYSLLPTPYCLKPRTKYLISMKNYRFYKRVVKIPKPKILVSTGILPP
ncbi:MAG: hypothetical protein F6K50_30545 [Moorea sp. SIO3I7]|uniref:hypothetical protein n=1 Tax=unclassified Moorena TaxID=2683338 RepID=UPI0013C0D163|nr:MULTISPECIES: hypothetical protein [unclassified Moorena]NEN99661.1 hypothetical protein [Moorena sp. SIO3I7]NEO09108.1 hypothetical protein [Moorena sp. SIO3I8]NEO65987.1 hypothetical protein [Moorena sp. SIO4G2]NEP21193.1 hypothetical protein [Moorena sp. SIO3I6]